MKKELIYGLTDNQFLADKKYWIEKSEKEYTLFVKCDGKTFQASVEKDRIEVAKELNSKFIKKSRIMLLIAQIELQINDYKTDILRKNLKQYEWN